MVRQWRRRLVPNPEWRRLRFELLEDRRVLATFTALSDHLGSEFLSADNAFDASFDGTVVVGHGTTVNGTEAYRWTMQEGVKALGDLPGGDHVSQAFGVSRDGTVVVGLGAAAAGFEAYRWTGASGMQGLGDLPGGSFGSAAKSVSAGGTIIVGNSASTRGVAEAFRWTDATGMQPLGDLPGGEFRSDAAAVSADGTVIVGTGKDDGAIRETAFRWTSDTGMVGIVQGGTASDVSADGSVVVGGLISQREAYRWTQSTGATPLGDLPGGILRSGAHAVSDDGLRIVGFGHTSSGREAFIWDMAKGMRNLKQVLETDFDLDLSGWTLREARGISGDGATIIGTGVDPNGKSDVWVADLVADNQPPEANANGPYTVDEGASIALSSAGSSGTIVLFEWDLDYDGTTFHVDASSTSPTFSAATIDGPAGRTVALRVTDDQGAVSNIATAQVTINNAQPRISSVTNNGPVHEGNPVTVTIASNDAAGANDPLTYSFDFDNDSVFEVSNSTGVAQHTFAHNGTFPVIVRVSDGDGGIAIASTTVSVGVVVFLDFMDFSARLTEIAASTGIFPFTQLEQSKIEDGIQDKLEQAYRDFSVTFVQANPGGVVSTIRFGADCDVDADCLARRSKGKTLLGKADGIDIRNQLHMDVARVFTENAFFAVAQSSQRTNQIQRLITVLAGTAGHELGHNLGLQHYDPYGDPLIDPTDTGGMQNSYVMATGSTGLDEIGRQFDRTFSPLSIAKLEFGDLLTGTPNPSIAEQNANHSTPTTAQSLGLGVVPDLAIAETRAINVVGSISTPFEQDHYSFVGRAGDVLTVNVISENNDNNVDHINSLLRLVGDDGMQLSRNDDITYTPTTFNEPDTSGHEFAYGTDSMILNYRLPSNGTFYIVVQDVASDIGPYELFATLHGDRFVQLDPGSGQLTVFGDPGNVNDSITLSQNSPLHVNVNGTTLTFDTGAVAGISVLGGNGNDRLTASGLTLPVTLDGGLGNDVLVGGSSSDTLLGREGRDWLYGANGNDRLFGDGGNDLLFGGLGDDLLNGGNGSDFLRGGFGNDILLGGSGRDALSGDAGRDLIVGGLGTDVLTGGLGEDILIGGTTMHDDDHTALSAVVAEWASDRDYDERVNNIRNGTGSVLRGTGISFEAGATVLDDGVIDFLHGGFGRDWFFALGTDIILGRRPNEPRN